MGKKGLPSRSLAWLVFVGALIIVSGVSALRYVQQNQYRVPQSSDAPAIITVLPRHPLTGALLDAPLAVLPHVFGVMIENSADAWPLSGIDEAFLVIEAPVEGDIPRFLAFFSSEQDVQKIGPVRSARSYYLDWNAEFDGIYAHVGGSPEALRMITGRGVFDLDQFFQSEYYYRDELTRYAPHNVYTTMDDLKQSMREIDKKYHAAAPTYDSWIFTDGVSETSVHTVITLSWRKGYDVQWTYDPTTNVYDRSQGGKTYTANNVVIIETDVGTIPGDDKGRRTIRTLGEGRMKIFQNGHGNDLGGTWKKSSVRDRMRFYDNEGNEMVMNAGKTWIEVTDDLGNVVIEQMYGL